MNDQTKIKVLGGLVALLVILNISMLGYMWFAPNGGRPGGPRDGRGPAGLVIKELKFDDAQQKQFEKLRDEHHGAMMKIGERERHLHDEFFKTLSDPNESSATVDSLITEILNGQKEREQITYHHLALVRQMCNPGQQKTFDNMIAKAMGENRREEGPPPPRD
ncbi:MAG: hypothetical protein JWO03_2430 [Bacteroidetes bacterium]|nr:hypothetical protein [Bacteroidota bacterium]